MGEWNARGPVEPGSDTPTDEPEVTVRVSRLDDRDGLGWALSARSLTPRQRALRGAGVVLSLVVALLLVIGGPATVGAWLSVLSAHLRIPTPPVATFTPGITNIPLPSALEGQTPLSIAAANGQPGTVALCWMGLHPVNGQLLPQPMVAFTSTSGRDWQVLAAPTAPGSMQSCSLTPDLLPHPQVLVALDPTIPDTTGCAQPTLELLDETTLSWQAIPWPAAVCANVMAHPVGVIGDTNSGFFLVGNAVYAWESTGLLSTSLGTRASGILKTVDNGQTWDTLDGHLAANTTLRLIGARTDGQLLVQTAAPTSQGTTNTLWQTSDDGASWFNRGNLPGANPRVVVTTNPIQSGTAGWGMLYVESTPLKQGKPQTGAVQLAMAQLTEQWTSIPLPPSASAAAPTPGAPVITSLSVGPEDSLLLTDNRNNEQQTTGQFTPPQNLWQWVPVENAWRLAGSTLAQNTILSTIAWQGNTLTCWLLQIYAGLPPAFTMRALRVAGTS